MNIGARSAGICRTLYMHKQVLRVSKAPCGRVCSSSTVWLSFSSNACSLSLQKWLTWHDLALDVTQNGLCRFWRIWSFCGQHRGQTARLNLRTYRKTLHTGIVIANPVDQVLCSLSILHDIYAQ